MARTVTGLVLVAVIVALSLWAAKSAYDKTRQPGPVVNLPKTEPPAKPAHGPETAAPSGPARVAAPGPVLAGGNNPSPSPSPAAAKTQPAGAAPPLAQVSPEAPPAAPALNLPLVYQPDGTFAKNLNLNRMGGIALDHDGKSLLVCGDQFAVRIDLRTDKEVLPRVSSGHQVFCVDIDADGSVYLGEDTRAEKWSKNAGGQYQRAFKTMPDNSLNHVTAIRLVGNEVVCADTGNRRLVYFDKSGVALNKQIPTTQVDLGKPLASPQKLVVTNDTLDFAVNLVGQIVLAHPGRHRVQTYDPAGRMLKEWGRFDEHDPEGFTGCCNPINVAVFPFYVLNNLDLKGRGLGIVTAEKAPPRVKVYDEEGRLVALIDSKNFNPKNLHMHVAVDGEGRIYVADTEAKIVRRFKAKK